MAQPESTTPVTPDNELPGYIPRPLLFAHKIFNTLVEHAKPETITLPLSDDPIEALVFRGKLTDVFEDSGASKAYYSPIRTILSECGAVIMLERGTAYSPSALVVDPSKPPPLANPPIVKSPDPAELLLTLTDEVGTLRESMKSTAERMGDLNIVEVLRNFEIRISRLERERK